MTQLMALPLTVSCFSNIQIGFVFLVLTYPDSSGQWDIKWVLLSHKGTDVTAFMTAHCRHY